MLKTLTVFLGLTVLPTVAFAQKAQLLGTWKLVAADVVRPDGVTAADYGPFPRGLAIFTADSQYVVESTVQRAPDLRPTTGPAVRRKSIGTRRSP